MCVCHCVIQVFVLVVWNFELYMLPLSLLMLLVWNYIFCLRETTDTVSIVCVCVGGFVFICVCFCMLDHNERNLFYLQSMEAMFDWEEEEEEEKVTSGLKSSARYVLMSQHK